MRYLILSCNTGAGHNSAADAIKDYFDAQGAECEVRDSLAFISKSSSYLVSNGHVLLYKKNPKLFGVLYRFFENHPVKENDRSFVYDILTLGAKSLGAYLSNNSYDGIICTHVFAGMMATATKRKYIDSLKIYVVATDYTCTPFTEEVDADVYFMPHGDLLYEYVQSDIPSSKIVCSGIPVRSRFYEEIPAEEAKKALNIDPEKKVILLMCGSMGCGPIETLTDTLEQQLPLDWRLVVICGSNHKLYKTLTTDKFYTKVTVVGFTKRMHLYMSAAEFALTKPGGLSSTEAFLKELPLILIDAVPGCETRNLEFFIQKGFAKTCPTEKLSQLVLDCIDDWNFLSKAKLTLREEFHNAPQIIFDTITKGHKNETIRL